MQIKKLGKLNIAGKILAKKPMLFQGTGSDLMITGNVIKGNFRLHNISFNIDGIYENTGDPTKFNFQTRMFFPEIRRSLPIVTQAQFKESPDNTTTILDTGIDFAVPNEPFSKQVENPENHIVTVVAPCEDPVLPEDPENPFDPSEDSAIRNCVPPGLTVSPTGEISGTPEGTTIPIVYQFVVQVPGRPDKEVTIVVPPIDKFPPAWITPEQGIIDHIIGGDSRSYTLTVDPDGNGSVASMVISQGSLPPGFNFTYDNTTDPNNFYINGTLDGATEITKLYKFCVKATNEFGAFNERYFGIFTGPDAGKLVWQDEGGVYIDIGPNVSKLLVKLWAGGGGGRLNELGPEWGSTSNGGAGTFSASLIDVAELETYGFYLGRGGYSVSQNEVEAAPGAPSTFFDENDTVIAIAYGGMGGSSTGDGASDASSNIGDYTTGGTGLVPPRTDIEGYVFPHAKGGLPTETGYRGLVILEWGPHVNNAASVNELI